MWKLGKSLKQPVSQRRNHKEKIENTLGWMSENESTTYQNLRDTEKVETVNTILKKNRSQINNLNFIP